VPSKRNKRLRAKEARSFPLDASRVRAYHHFVDQLIALRRRITERVPRWRAVFSQPTREWKEQTVELRLDFETYLTVLSRFFRLCEVIVGPEFGEDEIVKQIREVRNRVIEHGLDEPDGQGERGFFCGEQGPQLVLKEGIPCPPMDEIDTRVSELLDKYRLKAGDVARHHFSPVVQLSEEDWLQLLTSPLPGPGSRESSES
jgi:hypothetical protein